MTHRILSAAVALVATCSLVHASVFVVDDNPGPGVDFPDIASAVAVALGGDVVLVRPGTYGNFLVSRGIQVIGEGGVLVTGEIRIQGVPAGPRATIAKMQTSSIVVAECAATVLLEDLVVRPTNPASSNSAIHLRNSPDIRLRGVDVEAAIGNGMHAVRIDSARVEITHARLVGGRGQFQAAPQSDLDTGGDGILVTGTGVAHVSLSDARGGTGGDNFGCESCVGGDGGRGIRLQDSASLLLTGIASDLVLGGQPGYGDTCASDGTPGPGLAVYGGAQAQISGVAIHGGTTLCGGFEPWVIVGPYTTASPTDPSLELSGVTLPGQVVTYTLRGAPGAAARLRLGRQAILEDLPAVFEDRLVQPLRTFDLGALPPSGTATFALTLPSSLPSGFTVFAQASVVSPSGEVALTQSVPITLR
ncbi:MAG: hypothetical protein NTY35_06085 [Planctomycetota bacterium]|nr:hypothetical protein [Planctomycetota bacterium]